MKVHIFKFINQNSNGVFVSFNNTEEDVKINLLLDDKKIESIKTKKDNHLFNIEETGVYHVELLTSDANGDKDKIISNKITIKKINKTHNEIDFINSVLNNKTKNQKIDGINKYYLEIKILKGFEYKIKEEINLNFKMIHIDLSGIDKRNSSHNYCYLKYG